MHRYLILLPLLMLAACGGTMTKNVSHEQVLRDSAECKYEMSKAAVSASTDDYMSAFRETDLYKQCLALKGYKESN